MTNSEIPKTDSQTILDETYDGEFSVKRYSLPLSKEDAKGMATMSAEEAYYHMRILPTRSNFKPKVTVVCENYPDGCSRCCDKAFPHQERIATCNFGKHLTDTVEPMVLSMLEDEE